MSTDLVAKRAAFRALRGVMGVSSSSSYPEIF